MELEKERVYPGITTKKFTLRRRMRPALAPFGTRQDLLAVLWFLNTPHMDSEHAAVPTARQAAERIQFGRAIGSFQAIKHKCADMLLDVEMAKSAAYYAAAAAESHDPELPALASLAKASASEAYMRIAAECIQIHGGIGFTWDNDTHLWFKRAKSSEVFFGDPSYHKEQLITRWQH